MKILVLVKQVPDTWGDRKLDLRSGWLDRSESDLVLDEICERALEVALQYQETQSAEVVALTLGPDRARDCLKKALAMGADSGIHILDSGFAGADMVLTARAIAAALEQGGFDLVIAGNESTDGRGGVIPALIADLLGIPHLTNLNTTTISQTSVQGERATEWGLVQLTAPLPAIVSVNERAPEGRFPGFKGIMRAKKKPVVVYSKADLGLDDFTAGSQIVSVAEQPARSAGRTIADDGTAGIEIADFLAATRLI